MAAQSRRVGVYQVLLLIVVGILIVPGVPAQKVQDDGPIPVITAVGSLLNGPAPAREEDLISGQVPLLPVKSQEASALADLKARFTGELGRLLALIGQEADPQKAEELQKQCQTTKAREERAMMGLKADQTEARGDGATAAAIRDGISRLQKRARIAPKDRPVPEPNAAPPAPRAKTSDEL